jgi:hypothetical protein
VLQRIIRVFAEVFVSHDRHTLFALEESEPPRTTYTYTCESLLQLLSSPPPLTSARTVTMYEVMAAVSTATKLGSEVIALTVSASASPSVALTPAESLLVWS